METTKYQKLPQEETSDSVKHTSIWYPKLSRFKVLAVISILVLTCIFISIACLGRGLKEKSPVCITEMTTSAEPPDRIRFHHTKRKLPQCIIIGCRKAGTRALLRFLNIHSRIQVAGREIHFFDDVDNYSQGLEWYRKQMPYSFNDQITIEKTPAYFIKDDVPEKIYKMNESIRLLLIVRNPVDRTVSDYTQLLDNKRTKHKDYPTFEELTIDEDTGEIDKTYPPIKRSIYHRHMRRWLEVFPEEQIHIVDGDNLIVNPAAELRKVEQFLGLSHEIRKDNFYFNRSKGFFCIKVDKEESCLAQSKGREHPPIDSAVLEKLHDFFQPHNEEFFKQINRSFDW